MLQKSFNAYPAQIGLYAVKVKNAADWKGHECARLHVSVGQAYHEGDKFAATTEWARGRFGKVVVCVNDTLQLTNKMFEEGMARPEAFAAALDAGDAWIARNSGSLSGCDVVRWDEWKGGKDFAPTYRSVLKLEKADPAVSKSLIDTAGRLWERRAGQHPAYTPDRQDCFFALAREYLLDEIAVICCMIERERAVDIYPGTMLPVFDLLKGRDVTPAAIGRRDFVRIDFKRR